MTTMRVIAEDAATRSANGAVRTGLNRYASELIGALIDTAPPACDVELILSSRSRGEVARVVSEFPSASRVTTARLPHGVLAEAWANGFAVAAGTGILHAPSLYAPLVHADKTSARQLVVTIHDTVAWTHPESLGHSQARWTRRMARRAAKHADAIVVPTHAVADELADRIGVGDRVRVIPGAVSRQLALPADPDVRASWLQLPERYVLASGSMDPRAGIEPLIHAAALPDFDSTPVLILGPDEWAGRRITETAMLAGLPEGRVRPLGVVSDSDLALLFTRAAAFVSPSLGDGFGLAALESLSLGTPLVFSDTPAHLEVASGAGVPVVRFDAGSSYSERLASAVGSIVKSETDTEALRVLGRDRARAFSWRASAAQVWQLHAEL